MLTLVPFAWTLLIFFPKILAAASPHSPPPEPDSLAEASHHSPRPESLAQPVQLAAARFTGTLRGRGGPPSLAAASLTRRCPSHSPWPAVHRPPRPASLAAARVTRVTESVTESLTRRRLTYSVTRHCRGAKAEVCVIVRIWNNLIAIFGAPLSPFYLYS